MQIKYFGDFETINDEEFDITIENPVVYTH